MKVAVIGAGSTYTPELVSGLAQRGASTSASWCCTTSTRERLRGRRRARRSGCSTRQGFAGRLDAHRRARPRGRGRRRRADPDPRRRPGGAAVGRDACRCACGCIGQETTGAGGFAKALRTVPVVLDIADARASWPAPAPGSSTSPTRSASSPARCSTTATARSGCATSRSASSGAMARDARRRARARSLVDQVGLNHLTWVRAVWLDERDVLPELIAEPRRRARRAAVGLPRRLLDELGAVPSYYLRYFYAHDDVAGRAARGRDAARGDASPRSSASCWRCTPTPRSTTKPALLEQRGGAFYSEAATRLVASLATGDGRVARGRRAQRRHDRRAGRRRRGRGARRASTRDGAAPLPQRPLAPELLGLVAARRGLRAPGRGGRGDRRPRRRARALLAHPLIGQWGMVERAAGGGCSRATAGARP